MKKKVGNTLFNREISSTSIALNLYFHLLEFLFAEQGNFSISLVIT